MIKNTTYNPAKLHDIYQSTYNYISTDFEAAKETSYINPQWKEILSSRTCLPSFQNILCFLRNDLTFGLRVQAGSGNNEEFQAFKDVVIALKREMPNNWSEYPEHSLIGTPLLFNYDGVIGDINFIYNWITSSRIIKHLEKYSGKTKKIKILEIGAGLGANAFHLIENTNPTTYVICDLHENLLLSSFFLQANYPDKKVVFLQDQAIHASDYDFVFCTPLKLELIKESFDLVINQDSFQEMNLNEVHRYMNYIKVNLSDDGMLYSHNGHMNAGGGGMGRPNRASDYRYSENFEIVSMEYSHLPCFHLFNGNRYEVVLKKKNGKLKQHPLELDGLGFLVKLRLDKDLETLCKRFISGMLDEGERKFLALVSDFFEPVEYEQKRKCLGEIHAIGSNKAIIFFMQAHLEISQHMNEEAIHSLGQALDNGLGGKARMNALIYLELLKVYSGKKSNKEAVLDEVEINHPEFLHTATTLLTKVYSQKKFHWHIASLINVKERRIEIRRSRASRLRIALRKKNKNTKKKVEDEPFVYCMS